MAAATAKVLPLDETQVLEVLREVVAEKGEDYVYPLEEKDSHGICQYATYDEVGNPTGPSCIAGHVLFRLGVPLTDLARYEGEAITRARYGGNGVDSINDALTDEAREVLRYAQEQQDEGSTWGQALMSAEARRYTLDDD